MNEIGLEDLIFQVKRELLTPNPAARARDPYPIFWIDKVELEIAIKITQASNGGIKITVLDFGEASVGKTIEREHGHIIKVSLSPILSREEALKSIYGDEGIRKAVQSLTAQALAKGGSESS